MSYLEKQKIGVVVKDDPKNHLSRLYAMKIILKETRSHLELYGPEKMGKRPLVRKETHPTISIPRQAREYARKWRILRQNIQVIEDEQNNKPKAKKSK